MYRITYRSPARCGVTSKTVRERAMLGELLEAIFTILGSVCAYGGLTLLGYGVIARSTPQIAIGAAAFVIGLVLLQLSKRDA